METLKHYKFSLAFENSNEEDYVTEKFFHSLVAGKKTQVLCLIVDLVYLKKALLEADVVSKAMEMEVLAVLLSFSSAVPI